MNNFVYVIAQICVLIILLLIILFLIKQNIALKYENRIGKCSVEPINNNDVSLIESMRLKYFKFIKKARKYTNIFFKKTSLKYEKYLIYGEDTLAIDYITNKIIISLLLVSLTIIDGIFKYRTLSLFILSIIFSAIFGYYILDIYLIYNKRRRKRKIENDMLRAIIIMNNAFKAGKSTLQALEIASMELPSPINSEFKKMYHDMLYGLSADVVFERFAKRIDIESARYLSSSLTILNRTGGNIINVFDAIEKTLFDKQKLKEELKNSTASSNVVVKVLLAVPFIFVIMIYSISHDYFDPLFASPIGYVIVVIMFVMLTCYAYLLQKVIKVGV